MFPSFKSTIEQQLSDKLNATVVVKTFQSIGGGCINNANKISTSVGDYFIKWNDAKRYPGMFDTEAKGLSLLKQAGAIKIPELILTGIAEDKAFIVLEYIERGRQQKTFWENFGRNLAFLHKQSSPLFGLDHDNYIGSLPQNNNTSSSWIDFFIHQRLEKQVGLARSSDAIDKTTIQQFERLFNQLSELISAEPPALLHGDLWNGNYMIDADGAACLIDPAVYYGHREMDLAMTELFGGFPGEFYESYNNIYPLQSGFERRVDIHNLYPLMVHVNLFGGRYLSQVKSILSRF